MSQEEFRIIMEKTGDYLNNIVFGDKWEPALNDDIFGMVRLAREYGIETSVVTNFNIPTVRMKEIVNSGLDSITLSIDGTTAPVYRKYRRGEYNC